MKFMNDLKTTMVVGDTSSVTPNFSGAPGLSFTAQAAGWAEGGGLLLVVIGLVCGAVAFLFGKIGHQNQMQEKGVTFAVWALIAGAIIGSAGKLVAWSAGQPLI